MQSVKDSPEVIRFMTLFQKLRYWIDDEPCELEKLAAGDDGLKRLCHDLRNASTVLSMNEKRQRQLFSSPVNPKFIAAWRIYEEKYHSPISEIFAADLLSLGLNMEASSVIEKSSVRRRHPPKRSPKQRLFGKSPMIMPRIRLTELQLHYASRRSKLSRTGETLERGFENV